MIVIEAPVTKEILMSAMKFDYVTTTVSRLKANVIQNPTKFGRLKPECNSVEVEGREAKPSQRFWNSLYSMYGFNNAFFKYFSHDEVFARLQDRDADREIRVCVEDDGINTRLLACTNPNAGLITYDEMLDVAGRMGGSNVQYTDGMLESVYMPSVGGSTFNIGGDDFNPNVLLSAPIDGYGSPSLFIRLLRLACSNGMVAYDKAFQSKISLGKKDGDVSHSIVRHLNGYANDEGYAAIRQRIESAQNSKASMAEAMSLYSTIYKHKDSVIDYVDSVDVGDSLIERVADCGKRFSIVKSLVNLTGDISHMYGIASATMVSSKKLQLLPAKCSVYDLCNFATEVATHHMQPIGARAIHGWFGTKISNEYDLEGADLAHSSDGFKALHLSA